MQADKITSLSLLALFLLFPFLYAHSQAIAPDTEGMTNDKMNTILHSISNGVEGKSGNWQVEYKETTVMIVTDKVSNRMRIFTPVVKEEDLIEGQLSKMLTANFHSALDAKYSLFEGYVVSVYTHPLKELQLAQFKDAIDQVISLYETFGTTYSSTNFIFAPGKKVKEEKS